MRRDSSPGILLGECSGRGTCTFLPELAPLEPPGTSVANTDGKWIDTLMSGLTDGWRKVLVYACICSLCVIHWEVQSLFPYLPSPKPQPGLPLSLSVSPVKPSQT